MNRSRVTTRALAVVITTAVAAAIWGVQALLGVGVRMPSYGAVAPLPLVAVVVSALAGTLAGWGLLALLERFVPQRASVVWLVAAAVVFVLSLAGPLIMPGVGIGDRLWLVLLHVAVAGTFVALVRRTLAVSREALPVPRETHA